jgi:hypothetical protein
MTAASVTGKGPGSAKTPNSKELTILSNAPSILFSGTAESSGITSPPGVNNVVVFPTPLPGPSSNYIVITTTQNGGASYITSMDESNGNFIGFHFSTEVECTTMYIVTKIGTKSN